MPRRPPTPQWLYPNDLDFWTQIEMFYGLANSTCLGNTVSHGGDRTAPCGRLLDPTNPHQYRHASTGLRIDGLMSNHVRFTESIYSNVSFHGHRLLCPDHQDQTIQVLNFWYRRIRASVHVRRPWLWPGGLSFAFRSYSSCTVPYDLSALGWQPSPIPSVPSQAPVRTEASASPVTPPQEDTHLPPSQIRNPDARQPQRKCSAEPVPSVSNQTTQGASPHVPRRQLPDRCPLCFDQIDKEDSAVLQELVWCKSGCGNSLHVDCFDLWKETLLKDQDWDFGEDAPRDIWKNVTCITCRAVWEGPCFCDTQTLPEGHVEAGVEHIREALVNT